MAIRIGKVTNGYVSGMSRLDHEKEIRRGKREEIEEILRWKKPGDLIVYLGIEFFVIESGKNFVDSYGSYIKPHVVAEYCDKNNVIHTKEFNFELLKLIKSCGKEL